MAAPEHRQFLGKLFRLTHVDDRDIHRFRSGRECRQVLDRHTGGAQAGGLQHPEELVVRRAEENDSLGVHERSHRTRITVRANDETPGSGVPVIDVVG
jgi:hypothetical protein